MLFLTAKKKGLTYDKLRIWIAKKSFFPVKAEFLTLSGKPLKTAAYEGYKNLAGRVRPGTIRIQDSIRTQDTSVIEIEEMSVKKFPASLFSQNALK